MCTRWWINKRFFSAGPPSSTFWPNSRKCFHFWLFDFRNRFFGKFILEKVENFDQKYSKFILEKVKKILTKYGNFILEKLKIFNQKHSNQTQLVYSCFCKTSIGTEKRNSVRYPQQSCVVSSQTNSNRSLGPTDASISPTVAVWSGTVTIRHAEYAYPLWPTGPMYMYSSTVSVHPPVEAIDTLSRPTVARR